MCYQAGWYSSNTLALHSEGAISNIGWYARYPEFSQLLCPHFLYTICLGCDWMDDGVTCRLSWLLGFHDYHRTLSLVMLHHNYRGGNATSCTHRWMGSTWWHLIGSIKWRLNIEVSFLANTAESNPEFHIQIFHLAHCIRLYVPMIKLWECTEYQIPYWSPS